jgi:hypothetical protein
MIQINTNPKTGKKVRGIKIRGVAGSDIITFKFAVGSPLDSGAFCFYEVGNRSDYAILHCQDIPDPDQDPRKDGKFVGWIGKNQAKLWYNSQRKRAQKLENLLTTFDKGEK